MTEKRIALFIDADNISAKFGKQIIETLESRGEIFIRRIYGNWEKNSLHSWNECILNFSLRAIQQPDYVAGKNATDMSLTIDAMDVLYGGKAEIFAIVSNDSDFTPLVIRLREGGMKIIGLGNANASNSFRVACNEFITLDTPAEVEIPIKPLRKVRVPNKNSSMQLNLFAEEQLNPAAPIVESSKIISISDNQLQRERDKKAQQIHNVLREAAKVHGDITGFLDLSRAGELMSKKNFNVKGSGHSTLRKFIAAFPDLYELKNSSYRCLTVKSKSSVDKFKQVHNVLREAAGTYTDLNDENNFTALNRAGQKAHEKNLDIKNFGYGSWSKFIADFPKLYEVKKVGTIIYYRCK